MKTVVCVFAAVPILFGASAVDDEAPPLHGQDLQGNIANGNLYGWIQAYHDDSFKKNYHGALVPPGQTVKLEDLHGKRISFKDREFNNSISSIKWDLPDGLVAVLYAHENEYVKESGFGRQYMMFGRGQDPDFDRSEFNDAAGSLAFYYFGE